MLGFVLMLALATKGLRIFGVGSNSLRLSMVVFKDREKTKYYKVRHSITEASMKNVKLQSAKLSIMAR